MTSKITWHKLYGFFLFVDKPLFFLIQNKNNHTVMWKSELKGEICF